MEERLKGVYQLSGNKQVERMSRGWRGCRIEKRERERERQRLIDKRGHRTRGPTISESDKVAQTSQPDTNPAAKTEISNYDGKGRE